MTHSNIKSPGAEQPYLLKPQTFSFLNRMLVHPNPGLLPESLLLICYKKWSEHRALLL